MKKLDSMKLAGQIGVVASILAIVVFVTGKQSLGEFFGGAGQAVPEAPVNIKGCSSAIECPNSISARSLFTEEEMDRYNQAHDTTILPQDEIRFHTGWCTKTQELLYDNLHSMNTIFEIDGVSYRDQLKSHYSTSADPDDPAAENFCYLTGASLDGWKSGQTYTVTIGYRVDAVIEDGFDVIEKGDYLHTYILSVK